MSGRMVRAMGGLSGQQAEPMPERAGSAMLKQAGGMRADAREACPQCVRRSWLLAKLGARLDYRARDPDRLWELLALGDGALIDAIGGRRRSELHGAHDRFDPSVPPAHRAGVERICRHCESYPSALAATFPPKAPHPCLHVLGGAQRLRTSLEDGVAIVGTRKATDYGMEVAWTLGRDLAAAGVGVIGVFGEGIALAALRGALAGGGAPLAITAGAVERCSPSCCAGVFRRMSARGCLVSQLPPGTAARRWSALAAGRTIVLASKLTIVVEIEPDARELSYVELAKSAGKPVAAVPGRLTSHTAAGANGLLREGAVLLRDAHDALDLLYGVSVPRDPRPSLDLPPHTRALLQAIGDGEDTLAKLTDLGMGQAETVVALTELELLGLVVRGDGGRYVASLGRGAIDGGAAR